MCETFTRVQLLLVLSLLLYSFSHAQETEKRSPGVVCDRRYRVVSLTGAEDIGTYGIKITMAPERKEFVATESVILRKKRATREYTSTVVYSIGAEPHPRRGSVETRVNAEVCLRADVEFRGNIVSVTGTEYLDKRTTKKLEPPRLFEKKFELPAPGVLMLQSAVVALSPIVLCNDGERSGIVFIVFPDDVSGSDVIRFEKGCRLVRERVNEKGDYRVRIVRARTEVPPSLRGLPEEECFVDMEFLQSDDLHTITRMGDMKLIEIKQESRGKTSFENVPAAPREVRKDGRYPGPM